MNDIVNAHYTLGKAALEDGQVDQAITHFEASLKLDPEFIDAHHALALCYFSQHKLREAKDATQAALKLDPTYEPALSFLQAIEPQEPRTATAKQIPTENTEQPVRPVPSQQTKPSVDETELDTHKEMERGLVFLNNKQYPQAEALFKKVIKTNPQDAPAHYHLAQTYLEINALNDAQKEVDTALRLSPHYQPAHQLRDAILFVGKRNKQKQLQKKLKRYLIPFAIVVTLVLIAFNLGFFRSLLPEKSPPDVAIDAILEDPENKNGLIDAGELVRLKLTLTNSGSTVKNVKVRLSPKSIGGLRYDLPDRQLTLRKNGFETLRIPMTADQQARTQKITIQIEVLDKSLVVLATTSVHLHIKSK